MDPITNIQKLTDGVDKLIQKVGDLDAALSKVGQTANTSLTEASSGLTAAGGQRGNGQGGGNVMSTSLAGFTTPIQGPQSMGGQPGQMGGNGNGPGGPAAGAVAGPAEPGGNKLTGALATSSAAGFIDSMGKNAGIMQTGIGLAQIAMAPIAAAYASAMPTAGVVDRAGSYYQTIRNTGSTLSRSSVETATFNAMRGGMTGIGSDAVTGNILANAGFMPNSKNYLGLSREVAGAAINMGMENSVAANALPQLSNMSVANNLFNMGIRTLDNQGNQRGSGAIATDLMNRLYPAGATPEDIARSKQYGSLQNQLAGFNITGPLQDIIMRNMSTAAGGVNPDLTVNTNLGNNANPYSAIYQTNESQTGIQQKSEANVLSGMQTAADVVTRFNTAFGDTIAAMAKYRGMLELGLSTNAGQGISTGISSVFNGVKNVFGGLSQIATMATKLGGGTPGFGAAFGGGTPLNNSSGMSSSGSISAYYGVTSSSGIWDSTGGKHMGTDYDVDPGTPITSTLDGVVSGRTLSADYGQAVVVDHPNGYSTIYAHLKNKNVSPGDYVKAGQVVGQSGQTGNTTGPSLHYEVQRGAGNPVDPTELLGAGSPIGDIGSLGKSPGNGVNAGMGVGGVPIGGVSADAVDMKSWLVSQGLSENGAFGVVANLLAESGLRTNANGDGGTSYGIAQWHLGRKENLFKFAKDKGLDPSSLEAQQQFLMQELGTYGDLMNTLKSPDISKYEATSAFMTKFERPANQSPEAIQGRYNRGLGALNATGGGSPGYGGAFSGSGGSAAINNVNINLTIANASDGEAVIFAQKVKEYLSNDRSLSTIGSS
jgi:murein DD-endopeptidase MepM/ murein hydrolase activator NlpD